MLIFVSAWIIKTHKNVQMAIFGGREKVAKDPLLSKKTYMQTCFQVLQIIKFKNVTSKS